MARDLQEIVKEVRSELFADRETAELPPAPSPEEVRERVAARKRKEEGGGKMKVKLADRVRQYDVNYWISRQHEGDAGYDLRICGIHATRYRINGKPQLVPTGVHVEIPEGYMGMIRPRSSTSKRGIHIASGTIDSSFRGEIHVCVSTMDGKLQDLDYGERLAQLVIAPIFTPEIEWVEELSESDRGEKGFGASGRF